MHGVSFEVVAYIQKFKYLSLGDLTDYLVIVYIYDFVFYRLYKYM